MNKFFYEAKLKYLEQNIFNLRFINYLNVIKSLKYCHFPTKNFTTKGDIGHVLFLLYVFINEKTTHIGYNNIPVSTRLRSVSIKCCYVYLYLLEIISAFKTVCNLFI